ncbi:MAG: hypothetical protein LBH95_02260 [Oscillospiraceae bacterium]|jgi:hypothetical protein|nr:hypothetical protein [Oscillospiraceae bacterium]
MSGSIRKRARALFTARRGETLTEGIVSIFIFTVLMATVTMTLLVAARVTGEANGDGLAMQEEMRLEALDGTAASTSDVDFTFESTGGSVITVEDFPVPVRAPTTDYNFRVFGP